MKADKNKKAANPFREMLKDKNGYYNLREIVTALFVLIVFVGWIAQQFFSFVFPEYMFYGFISLIATGCFGYSIEKKQRFDHDPDFDKKETNI